jgi:hypothetical protein
MVPNNSIRVDRRYCLFWYVRVLMSIQAWLWSDGYPPPGSCFFPSGTWFYMLYRLPIVWKVPS